MSTLVFNSQLTSAEDVANFSYSSQATGYAATNLYDLNRRSKKWRSQNNFTVVSGDNTLVFRETVGVDLTATITAGSYATDALFFAAVKSALEAAGDSTYTVQRDTTSKRIEIISNGSGGGGIFQLMLTDANSADVAALLGFDTAANLTGALTYEADLLVIHSDEWITWDFGFPVNPTGFFAFTGRNNVLQISPTATVKLQGNWTNNFSGTPAETFTITYRDFILSLIDEDGIAQNSVPGYRYWRMQIVDKANPDLFVELGVAYLGTDLTVTRGCPAFPFEVPNIDRSQIAFSEGGQTFAARRNNTQQFGLNWQALDIATKEEFDNLFEQVGTHTSFIVAMDKNTVFSTDGYKWVRPVKFDREPVSSLVAPGIWESRWILREEL